MQNSSLSLQFLQQLLQEQNNKIDRLRNIENQTFQEYQFHNLQHTKKDMIQYIIQLVKNKQINTNILDQIIQSQSLVSSSILSFCRNISEIFTENQIIKFKHKQRYSQGLLLSIFLSKLKKRKIDYLCHQKSLRGLSKILIDSKIQNKEESIRQIAQKQKIILHSYFEWKHKININKQSTLIIDIFNIQPTQYIPFILHNLQQISIAKSIIFYYNQIQEQQLFQFIDKIQLSKINNNISNKLKNSINIQLCQSNPLDYQEEKDQNAILQKLVKFVKQDQHRANKLDIAIFVPSKIPIKKYHNKISQCLSKNLLKQSVIIITKSGQKLQNKKYNHIFLVQSQSQLKQWDYDYSRLLYVIDYGEQASFKFDYILGTHVKSYGPCSIQQKSKRINMINSNKVGRYSCLKTKNNFNNHYSQRVSQLSRFIYQMIHYQLLQFIDLTRPRIQACIQFLQNAQIIKQQSKKIVITDNRLINIVNQGVLPLEAACIYKFIDQNNTKLSNLMVIALTFIHTPLNIKQSKQLFEASGKIKPSQIWRKSGQLQSSVLIYTKYKILQNKCEKIVQKMDLKRGQSYNQYENEAYGCLFQQQQKKKKKVFDEMTQQQFLKECGVDIQAFRVIQSQINKLNKIFQLQQTIINVQEQDIINVIQSYISFNKLPIAVYTGSRRLGYSFGKITSMFPNKSSLMAQLNDRPEIVLVMNLTLENQRYQLLTTNYISQQTYLGTLGKLPFRLVSSTGQIQLQFHGISSLTFAQLWKHNGSIITKFEAENDCFVQSNPEMAMLVIHTSKQKADGLKKTFEVILQKIKQKVSISSKLIHYLGNTSVLLGAGGAVLDLVHTDYINKCLISNLHLQITKQQLQDLFQQFVVTQKIQVQDPEPGKFSKNAIVHFNSQRDYYKFKEYFHQCLLYQRIMDIKPLRDQTSSKIIKAKQYIQFKWYVWKSHGKALVRFNTNQQAKKAEQNFLTNNKLDSVNVKVILNNNQITIQGLKPSTDQIFIEQALKAFGQIKQVQILKTPLKEISGQILYLQNLIKALIQAGDDKFNSQPIQKHKNGLRICRIHFKQINHMNLVSQQLNKQINKLGQGRLYAQTWFQNPTIVPKGSMSVYNEIIDNELQKCKKNQNLHVNYYITQQDNKLYFIFKSPIKQQLDIFYQKITFALKGYDIPLSDYQKNIILSQIGLSNILDLEQKHHCKLIPNSFDRSLKALIIDQKYTIIKQQIKSRVQESFFYRVSLNNRTFKSLKMNPNKIKQIKQKYTLKITQLQVESKSILLQGSAVNVQKAFNYLMHYIQSLTVPAQQLLNADACGICCQESHRSYRLQKCSHKFCRQCLCQYINTALGDNSLFPIKCPHCFIQIVIDDLQSLLDVQQWGKIQTMAINQYVTKHGQTISFCFNVGCKQITHIKLDHIECDVCLSTFCILCKLKYHPGLTCQQAKEGGDQLFKKYMLENKIRSCPNKLCKIPVDRVDGCYRVTCSRCNKSMCFKCQPDKMIAYDDYNQCYQHLNEVHGGYW